MTITQEPRTAPPVHPSVYVEALNHVGRLTDKGLPAPTLIANDVRGEVVVYVRPDDLPAWVIELDLPAPEWNVTTSRDGQTIARCATWPEHVFLELLFRISSHDVLPASYDPTIASTD